MMLIGLMYDDISSSKFTTKHHASFMQNYSQPLARAYCLHVGILFIFGTLGIRSDEIYTEFIFQKRGLVVKLDSLT